MNSGEAEIYEVFGLPFGTMAKKENERNRNIKIAIQTQNKNGK